MTRHERISRALRGYAATRVTGTEDPWPEIRERALAGKHPERRSPRRFRFAPKTKMGWAFAVLVVMLVGGTSAYAASELSESSYDLFRWDVPGATQGNGRPSGSADTEDVSVPLNLTQTAYGVRVTVERAYADERSIVVSYTVEDLEDRRIDGWPELSATDGRLTDESGNEFKPDPGGREVSRDRTPPRTRRSSWHKEGSLREKRNVSASSSPLTATRHPSESSPGKEVSRFERIGERPFVFEFEVPVQPIPVVEVGQKDTANGITLTLDRVNNSPGRPEAVFCFEPPDGDYYWHAQIKDGAGTYSRVVEPERPGDNCVAIPLGDRPKGRTSLTVLDIYADFPKNVNLEDLDQDDLDKINAEIPKPIYGPWTFEFEMPESKVPEQ